MMDLNQKGSKGILKSPWGLSYWHLPENPFHKSSRSPRIGYLKRGERMTEK
jgi:hypothetical protein